MEEQLKQQVTKVEQTTEYATEHPQPAAADTGLPVATPVTLPEVEAANATEEQQEPAPEGK